MGKSRSLFWDDPGQLSLLAARVRVQRLTAPPPREDRPSTVVDSPPSPRSRVALASRAVSASQAVSASRAVSTSQTTVGKEPSFVVPVGSVEVKLSAFLRWLEEVTSFGQAFVSDEEGLGLVEENSSAEMIASASVMGRNWRENHGGLGLPGAEGFSADLVTGERLHTLALETDWGRLILGFLTRETIPSETLSRIGDALKRCLKKDDESEGINHDT